MKIAVDFFRLELVNHLFEAGLWRRTFARSSSLPFNGLLWSLSYFSHAGSVPCPSCGNQEFLAHLCYSCSGGFLNVDVSFKMLLERSVPKLSMQLSGLDSCCVMVLPEHGMTPYWPG